MLFLSGNLISKRCKVKHLTEYGPERPCLLRRKKLDIINEQLFDRLFSTFCVYIKDTSHADKRSLALGPPWGIHLEVCDSVQSAKGSETVTLLSNIVAC